MTLRDYFIAKALQGYCANPSLVEENYKHIADMAVLQADTVLKAREQ